MVADTARPPSARPPHTGPITIVHCAAMLSAQCNEVHIHIQYTYSTRIYYGTVLEDEITVVDKNTIGMKTRSERRKHCTPKKFRPAADVLPGGRGSRKFNQLEMVSGHYLHLQTQFGEDRCTQFRVIVVTDTARPPQTHRQDRLQYTAPLASAQCS